MYQPSAGECQASQSQAAASLETNQCQLRQQVCHASQMQYIVLFVLFICVLLFVVSLYYDTASRHSYCVNCRRGLGLGLDFDYNDRAGDGLFS